jgi:hypothetical protein
MAGTDAVRNKVQRLLANRFGSVRVDGDGDFVIQHESAVVFVRVVEWVDNTIIKIESPLVKGVEITPELTHWMAVDGNYILGNAKLVPEDDGRTGWIFFGYNLLGDDLDEPELMEALNSVVILSNKLDNELRDRFGGELFGPDV